jgi:uncharacterized membrane protein (UPF0127 family)
MYCFSILGYVPLALKVLDKNHLRQKGFMGWSHPPNDHFGMLFHHDIEHPQSYWMHTVPFDLDCLGFNKHNQLVEIIPLKALSMASKSFSKPVQHVVEVRGGWCKDMGLKGNEKLVIRQL